METIDTGPLVHLLDHALRELPDGTELTYIDAQKIFYLTRRRLDSDNRIAQSLPVYWYVHGPMSKAVSYTLNTAKQAAVVDGETTPTAGQVYTRGDGEPPEIDDDEDLQRARAAIDAVLDEYDLSSDLDDRLREDIYIDAPYDFQRYYKFDVLPAIEEFAREHYVITHPPEEIRFRLARAEATVPSEPAFSEFGRLFSRFVTLAETYLDEVDESEKTAVETFEQLAHDAWDVFAKRVRIEVHDDAYEDTVASWELEYERARQSFDGDLRSFEATLDDQLDRFGASGSESADAHEESLRVSEDSGWGAVNSALLEGERVE
jgi:hypothetical protein